LKTEQIEQTCNPGVDVVADDIVKVYGSGKTETVALRGLSMRVETGEAVAVMGPSGCGKTTLLNMIGGVDRPTAGTIVIDDLKLTEATERELEEHRLLTVGFVFQTFNLIPMLNAIENVELPMILSGVPGKEKEERAKALLEIVGLGEKLFNKPSELSIGEQQRVAIAAALGNDPPVILADEPTGELDTRNAMMVTDLIVGLSQKYKKTVIIATHDPRVAVRTNRILRIEDGVISGEFTPLELQQPETHTGLSQLIRLRLDSMKEEYTSLEKRLKDGELKVSEFNKKYNRVTDLEKALKELLAQIGG
jgi:ABC-type lipoprotein export system ATPase subunit